MLHFYLIWLVVRLFWLPCDILLCDYIYRQIITGCPKTSLKPEIGRLVNWLTQSSSALTRAHALKESLDVWQTQQSRSFKIATCNFDFPLFFLSLFTNEFWMFGRPQLSSLQLEALPTVKFQATSAHSERPRPRKVWTEHLLCSLCVWASSIISCPSWVQSMPAELVKNKGTSSYLP